MDIPWLTCPSVWSKKILSSRSQVEQSYAHGLRRWAGYQRYRLQVDKGKSAEPFRQILELMIRDAERQADVIDNNIYNMGDTPEGVMGRIKNFESSWYKPRRQKLTKRIANVREESHRMNRSHIKSEVIANNIAMDTQDVRCAWIKLQKDRIKHLAACLSEFVTCLEARQSNRDNNQVDTFACRQMEAALKKLSPIWLQEFETQLRHAPTLGDVESRTQWGQSDTALSTPSHSHSTPSATEVPVQLEAECDACQCVNNDEDSNDLLNADTSSSARSLCNPSIPRRYPTSITNVAAVSLANSSRDIGSIALHKRSAGALDQILKGSSRRFLESGNLNDYARVKLCEDCQLPPTRSLIPFITTGPPPTIVKLQASNPKAQLTADNLQRFQDCQVEGLCAEGQRSKLNPTEIKIHTLKGVGGDSKASLHKYPKIPAISSTAKSSKLVKAKSTSMPSSAMVTPSARRVTKSVAPPKIVSLYHHRSVQANGKALQHAKKNVKPVVKGITIRLPPLT